MQYSRGDYFGELALLHTQARAANVTTKHGCSCVELSRTDFKRLLGPLTSIMNRAYANTSRRRVQARWQRVVRRLNNVLALQWVIRQRRRVAMNSVTLCFYNNPPLEANFIVYSLPSCLTSLPLSAIFAFMLLLLSAAADVIETPNAFGSTMWVALHACALGMSLVLYVIARFATEKLPLVDSPALTATLVKANSLLLVFIVAGAMFGGWWSLGIEQYFETCAPRPRASVARGLFHQEAVRSVWLGGFQDAAPHASELAKR